jgi:hypothetical protein
MHRKIGFAALIAAVSLLAAAAAPSARAAPPEDACALLARPAVSAVLGVSVGDGTYVTPGFTKTCTWATPRAATKGAKYEYVTLALEAPGSFEGGKMLMGQKSIAVTSVGGVGDDAYYLGVGSNVGLIVKKGGVVFKVAVYGDVPIETKKAAEKTLARDVLSRL